MSRVRIGSYTSPQSQAINHCSRNNKASGAIQQEIKAFHARAVPVLNSALAEFSAQGSSQIYTNIIQPGKRLIQKCSCKSFSDIYRLNALAYWLYIYGYKKIALEICELTRDIDFAAEYGTTIPNALGLEIRIARELLGENRRSNIPPNILEYYLAKRIKKKLKYPDILREAEIAACRTDSSINLELLYALYNMIGFGETGLYNQLNDNWAKIETAIVEYIAYLRAE